MGPPFVYVVLGFDMLRQFVVLTVLLLQFTGSIGIITPYRGQVALLRSKLNAAFSREYGAFASRIEVNTVDGFQVSDNAELVC